MAKLRRQVLLERLEIEVTDKERKKRKPVPVRGAWDRYVYLEGMKSLGIKIREIT